MKPITDFNQLPKVLQKFLTELNKEHKIAAISLVVDPTTYVECYQVAVKGNVFYIYHEPFSDMWSWRNRNDKHTTHLFLEEK